MAWFLFQLLVGMTASAPVCEAAASLRHSSRLQSPELILKPFDRGERHTRVIVSLAAPELFQDKTDLRERAGRIRRRSAVREHLDAVLPEVDSSQIKTYRTYDYMPSFSARVTREGVEALASKAGVLVIEPDRMLHARTAQGIPLLNAAPVRDAYGGDGVAMAVCDTGIDYTHSKLGGGGFPNAKVIGGYDFGDDDGMPAEWGIEYFTDISTTDGTGDQDQEGLSDLDEYAAGTDPTRPDTDEDGFTDQEEILAGTDPLDQGSFPASVPALSAWGVVLGAMGLQLFMLFRSFRRECRSANGMGRGLGVKGASPEELLWQDATKKHRGS